MKTSKKINIVLLAVLGVILVLNGVNLYSGWGNDRSSSADTATNLQIIAAESASAGAVEQEVASVEISSAGTFGGAATGSTKDGDVSIELTPQIVGDRLEVAVAANTHTIDLSPFDFSEIATLEYNGKMVKPVESSSLSGHHSSGLITFPIEGDLTTFTITILGIPNIEERVFSWE
jgi:hypothetical protein